MKHEIPFQQLIVLYRTFYLYFNRIGQTVSDQFLLLTLVRQWLAAELFQEPLLVDDVASMIAKGDEYIKKMGLVW